MTRDRRESIETVQVGIRAGSPGGRITVGFGGEVGEAPWKAEAEVLR